MIAGGLEVLMPKAGIATRILVGTVVGSAMLGLAIIAAAAQDTSGRHPHVGIEIVGSADAMGLGRSVALSADGTRVIVGTSSIVHLDPGAAQVFEWRSGAWHQLGADLVGHSADDIYGFAVAISADGDRVAVGGPYHGDRFDEGVHAGHVQVFDWNGEEWIQVGGDVNGISHGDVAGESVDLSADGDRLLVGATGWDGQGGPPGSARVYEWNGSSWTQLGQDLVGEASEDDFGVSGAISSDGNRIVVGARFNRNGGQSAGHARVFEWSGTGWKQLGPDIDSQFIQSTTGWAVDITANGERVIIASPSSPTGPGTRLPGHGTGRVRVFDWTGSEWKLVGAPIVGEATNSSTGAGVAISEDGNTIMVSSLAGLPPHDTERGLVRIYEWDGSSWSQRARTIKGFGYNDEFGSAVSLSADGSTAAIGAPGIGEDSENWLPGYVRVVRTDVVPLGTCAGVTATVDMSNGEQPTDSHDVILGTRWPDWIDALAGDDIICPLAGDDVVLAGDGNDVVYGGSGDDAVLGGAGRDLLLGGLGADRIDGGDDNDRVRGGDGDDYLVGEAGQDSLRGGNGHDRLEGGLGNDLMWGNMGRDAMFGDEGDDVLRGGAWRDSMNGGAGDNDGCTINDPAGLQESRQLCETGVYNR